MRMFRIVQNPLHPCPPGTHGCTDPWHPLRVDLAPVPEDGSPVSVGLALGVATVTVQLIDTPERPGVKVSNP